MTASRLLRWLDSRIRVNQRRSFWRSNCRCGVKP